MKKNNTIEEEVIKEIEFDSANISSEDINEIISEEEKINSKSSKLDLKRFSRLINQTRLALSLIKDFKNKRYTDIPWRSIALISAAIIYFVNPFDMVPDVLPLFGFADDAMLFATLFKSIQVDLVKYGDWKGINTSDYF